MGLRLDSVDRQYLQREIDRLGRINWRARQCCRRRNWYARMLAKTCRLAVVDQIDEFREYWFRRFADQEVVCPLLGVAITKGESHVDHVPPHNFAKLVDDWLAQESVDLESVCATGVFGLPVARFRDAGLQGRWEDYHREHAVLRVVSPSSAR